ncbi:lipopolysaccharide core biosynthesis protein RfaZ [Klebsiella pneumoniae subsp. ozaenae]|uniref:Lipopolysaccharide core biosynthesis protein RfaZ n=1 Tax=Klebsiella pneumoniae subsp. ozaenae TaxID=574 RepID=A0A377YVZ4_KLEPO|nr:lipopolysaccharide core biosynthesis protein RfaZ [Klebsiella pneumoniae subsp. ozaenae]
MLSSSAPDICFSTDIRQGIFDAGTVVYWALQILAWLGFNTILVSGLDMTNFNQPRFYETQQENCLLTWQQKWIPSSCPPLRMPRRYCSNARFG